MPSDIADSRALNATGYLGECCFTSVNPRVWRKAIEIFRTNGHPRCRGGVLPAARFGGLEGPAEFLFQDEPLTRLYLKRRNGGWQTDDSVSDSPDDGWTCKI
jgi:hypothetical protein